jgi:hypothetical protein
VLENPRIRTIPRVQSLDDSTGIDRRLILLSVEMIKYLREGRLEIFRDCPHTITWIECSSIVAEYS